MPYYIITGRKRSPFNNNTCVSATSDATKYYCSNYALIFSMSSKVFDVLNMTDYYQVLDLPRNATLEEIRHSYRNKVRIYHPDKNLQNKQWAEEKFKKVQIAYQTLSDESTRRAYDRYGDNYRHVSTNTGFTVISQTSYTFQGPHGNYSYKTTTYTM